jgi:hypothetical protein
MRRSLGVLFAVASLLPMIAVGASPAGAATGTKCSAVSGLSTLKPGLPNTAATAKPTISVKGAKVGGCVGGGVTSGTLGATLKFGIAGNCVGLAKQLVFKITGPITIAWKPSGISTIKAATLTPGPKGKITQVKLSGTVSSGTFVGEKFSSLITFTLSGGQCGTKPLTSVSFKQVTPMTIS